MNEIRAIECKRAAQKRLEDVITACNKGDVEELRALMVCGLMTDEEFDTLCKRDGELLNNESVFRCDEFLFQVSEDFAYSEREAKSTDRYIIWAYCISNDIPIADIAYWQWGCPFDGDRVSESVLTMCRRWIEKAKSQGLKPHDILKED
jgi:hypothetical protein